MRYEESVLNSRDDTELFVRQYFADVDDAPTALIVHGFAEYGGRYKHIATKLVENGWNVVVPDYRGHGKSGGTPTHVRRFHEFVTDIATVYDTLDLGAARPTIIGHSMGGLIAIRFLQRYSPAVRSVILTSPLLGVAVPIPGHVWAAGRLMSLFAPQFRFQSRVPPSMVTRNEDAVQRRIDDPLVHSTITAGCFFAMKRAIRFAWRDAARIECPIFLLQAGDDHVVDPRAARSWLERTSSVDREFHIFPEHYHELLNEPDWITVLSTILDWAEPRNRRDATPITTHGVAV